MVFDVLKKLWAISSRRERKRLILVFCSMILGGVADVVSVAAVLPFLAVLADPNLIETNALLGWFRDLTGATETDQFLRVLGGAVLVMILAGAALRMGVSFIAARFGHMRTYHLSSRLLEIYLRQPYAWFLARNSSDLTKTILVEVAQSTGTVIVPLMRLIAQAMSLVSVLIFLIAVEPVIALSVLTVFSGSYLGIFLMVRSSLSRLGQERVLLNTQRFRVANEALHGIKDVKLMGLEEDYSARHRRSVLRWAHNLAYSQVVAETPRYALEAITFGGMIVLVLVLLASGDGDLRSVLPVLGLFAVAGLRMLPALQAAYHSLAMIRTGKAVFDLVYHELTQFEKTSLPIPRGARARAPGDAVLATPPLAITHEIALVDAHYSYPEASRGALNGLNLTIPVKTTIGIVGASGAGKTTAVDGLLGLLAFDAGGIHVDGAPLSRAQLRAFQDQIGYVPQQIYLTDDTIAANIAFGVPKDRIDQDAVERAARLASLHDFIRQDLPKGYDTFVGERGMRLSGGQRQRIGIARALYHDPVILIFDEATSALDTLTERVIMEAVNRLGKDKTIVMIAHRLSTVETCDRIFMLEQGRMVASGTYAKLVESNETFRAMAGGDRDTPAAASE